MANKKGFWRAVKDLAVVEALASFLKDILSGTAKDHVKKHIEVLAGGKGHEEEAIALSSLATVEMEDEKKAALAKAFFNLIHEVTTADKKETEEKVSGFLLMLASNTETDKGRYIHAENTWKAIVLAGEKDEKSLKQAILSAGHNFRQKSHKDKLNKVTERIKNNELWKFFMNFHKTAEDGLEAISASMQTTASKIRQKREVELARRKEATDQRKAKRFKLFQGKGDKK